MGEEIGLEKGDAVTHFDGKPVADVLDYEYYEGQEEFSLTVLTKDGQTVTVDVEKDCDETLGLTFEDGCYLTPRACRNKCVFCFVDQMPRGMRKTLYFKDDDWRLSFAAGNYVTFTNLTEEEINRVCFSARHRRRIKAAHAGQSFRRGDNAADEAFRRRGNHHARPDSVVSRA